MMLSNRECESVLDDTLQILHCMTNFSTAVVIIVKGRDISILHYSAPQMWHWQRS